MKNKTSKPLYPPTLQPGCKVALIAPAFSFNKEFFEQACIILENRYGLKPVFLDSVFEQTSYFAGSDERRLEELFHWITHRDIHAILTVRGGYGCARIYPRLLQKLKKQRSLPPKIILGYSDATVLLNGLYQDLGWITFHSPVIVSHAFRDPLPIEETSFHRALFSMDPLGSIQDPQMVTVFPGKSKAKLVGGCLSLLAASIGTPYEIQTKGKILFIEDVTEKPYRLDRMLTQLLHAGKFSDVRGLIFGQMKDCGTSAEALEAIKSALMPFIEEQEIPTIYHFPAGHGSPQITFPIGCEVELLADPANPEVRFLEAGTRRLRD